MNFVKSNGRFFFTLNRDLHCYFSLKKKPKNSETKNKIIKSDQNVIQIKSF